MPNKRKSRVKNTSDQKENRPKKAKVNKPKPNEGIDMSKQLRLRKSNNRSTRPSRNRVASVGKPMPSLADLEKMYEDSDDDGNETTPSKSNIQSRSASPEQQVPTVIDIDALFSPRSRSKIKKQAEEIISLISDTNDCHYNDITLPRPLKLPKFDISNDVCDSLPLVTSTPKQRIQNDHTLNNQINMNNLELTNVIQVRDNDNDNGNLSDNSTDSNKTIEYKLSPSTSQNQSISSTFCPLPSTSKDNVTFIKNDELFNESLKECIVTQNDLPKENEGDIQIIESPTETITIDDGQISESCHVNTKTENNVESVAATNQYNSLLKRDTEIISDDNDDDCIVVENDINIITKDDNNRAIELEYENIEPEINNTDNIDDEIIDVDAVIALNNTILSKYQNSDSRRLNNSNLVVDVDVSNTAESNNVQSNVQHSDDLPDVVMETNENIPNAQDQIDNLQESCVLVACSVQQNIKHSVASHDTVNTNTIDVESYNINNNMEELQRNLILNSVRNFFSNIHRNPSIPELYDFNSNCGPVRRTGMNKPLSRRTQRSPKNNRNKANKTDNNASTTLSASQITTPESTAERPSVNLGDCPICMDTLSGKVLASTICGHVFCMECLRQSLSANGKKCPTCRKALRTKGSYHQLFL